MDFSSRNNFFDTNMMHLYSTEHLPNSRSTLSHSSGNLPGRGGLARELRDHLCRFLVWLQVLLGY